MATGGGQDRRDGDAHRLADPQQGAVAATTRASPSGSSSSRPGITIRDRLRVLLPEDAENYYDLRDLVPADL